MYTPCTKILDCDSWNSFMIRNVSSEELCQFFTLFPWTDVRPTHFIITIAIPRKQIINIHISVKWIPFSITLTVILTLSEKNIKNIIQTSALCFGLAAHSAWLRYNVGTGRCIGGGAAAPGCPCGHRTRRL